MQIFKVILYLNMFFYSLFLLKPVIGPSCEKKFNSVYYGAVPEFSCRLAEHDFVPRHVFFGGLLIHQQF